MPGLANLYNGAMSFLGMDNPEGTLQGTANAFIAPALATAAKQYADSGRYERAGEQAAATANPFGDRSYFKNRLQSMYTDPNYIFSDPSYQWRLQQGMGATNRMLNAQGYQGSGKSAIDLTNYAQNAAAQEWKAEHDRLYDAAGGKFDPANAAKYQMEGQKLKMDSENAALGSLFLPGLMQAANNNIANQDTTRRIDPTRGGVPGSNSGVGPSASQLASWAQQGLRYISDGRGGGDLFDESGKQVGTLDQNGNVVPSYPTDPNDPRFGGPSYDDGPYGDNDLSLPPVSNIPTQVDPAIADQYWVPVDDNPWWGYDGLDTGGG